MVKIVVLCDGTWSGVAASSVSNVELMKRAFTGGEKGDFSEEDNCWKWQNAGTAGVSRGGVVVGFFDGVGLDSTESFLGYLFNGATAQSIDKRCKEAYRFIAKHFKNPHTDEVWLFGFSRGAYTVRCVAGMINNCGIVRSNTNKSLPLDTLVDQVYNMYRSRDPAYNPSNSHATSLQHFKQRFSYSKAERPPIRFMGLFDTVGSLGLPRFNAGRALDYAEFFDQQVSSEVQHVYQALAIHDRLAVFEPCFVRRKPGLGAGDDGCGQYKGLKYSTQEAWFPGCHYDVGRSTFHFARNRKAAALHSPLAALRSAATAPLLFAATALQRALQGRLLAFLAEQDLLAGVAAQLADWAETALHLLLKGLGIGVITPSEEYSDAAMEWMLGGVRAVDPGALDAGAADTVVALAGRRGRPGSGDLYGLLVAGLTRAVPLAGPLWPRLLVRDRMIPLDTPAGRVLSDGTEPLDKYPSRAQQVWRQLAAA